MSARPYLLITGTFFGLGGLAHFVRAALAWPLQIGTLAVPVWLSWLAALIAGGVCVWAFRIRRALAKPHDSLDTGSSSP
jgi:hypothetical protein